MEKATKQAIDTYKRLDAARKEWLEAARELGKAKLDLAREEPQVIFRCLTSIPDSSFKSLGSNDMERKHNIALLLATDEEYVKKQQRVLEAEYQERMAKAEVDGLRDVLKIYLTILEAKND